MRQIRIQGTAIDADIVVTINWVICKDILKDYIFSFESPSEFHGSASISIQVVAGQITLGQTLAQYPTNLGSIIFPIPTNPIARIHNERIEQLSNVKISAGEIFEYDHLIVNGPDYWITDTAGNVYIEDINWPHINLSPVFEYNPYPSSHKNNLAFTELERFIIAKSQLSQSTNAKVVD